jgi:hypothetical protein
MPAAKGEPARLVNEPSELTVKAKISPAELATYNVCPNNAIGPGDASTAKGPKDAGDTIGSWLLIEYARIALFPGSET